MVGQSIGHYRILQKLGEGGMGLVYKAWDTHLDRVVAVKVLRSEKVADPDRRRRFVQEAKAASALEHPNIIAIHDVGQFEGIDYISMECVAGKTLDRLIPRHGLRLSEALRYAVQVAEALARAHAAGIIHRDLKPGNIMVDEHGLVKVLDFGLAKLTEKEEPDKDENTRTLDVHTGEGAIVGTVAYMSPEQVEGNSVDARSDVFSFGALLYEMITGHTAFRRESRMATLAAILKEDPDPPSQVVPGLPREVERIVLQCLRKDPARRLQHMDDIRALLQDLKEESESGLLERTVGSGRRRKTSWRWPAGIFALGVAAAAIWFAATSRSPAPALKAVPFTTYRGWEEDPSFSPEGGRVTFSWNGLSQRNWDIYVKQVGEEEPLRLTRDPADDFSPAWSPDGATIAFLRGEKDSFELISIPAVTGSRETRLTTLNTATTYRGYPNRELAWSPDSAYVVFFDRPSPGEPPGLFLFNITTRKRRRLTTCPTTMLRDSDPAFSPDGRTLAFVRVSTYSFSRLYLLSLSPALDPVGQPRRIAPQLRSVAQPAWMPDGKQIVFSASGDLWRISSKGSGRPEHLPFGGEQLDVSRLGGRMVFNVPDRDSNIWQVRLTGRKLASVPASFIGSTREDTNPSYSPDGKRIAFASNRTGNFEIWVCGSDGAHATQLTTLGATESGSPRWSPDGRKVVFDSDKEGFFNIYTIDSDGGEAKRLTTEDVDQSTPAFSRDGKTIYFASRKTGAWEIWRMPSEGGAPTRVTQKGGFSPFVPPAGAHLYYQKTEGRFSELWRVPFEGGEETRVLDSVGDRRFAVQDDGIYFIEWPDYHSDASLQFYSFAARKTEKIAGLEGPFLFFDFGLTISPDSTSVLYTHPDRPDSDLMLVEHFR